jgi:hypothetical protein
MLDRRSLVAASRGARLRRTILRDILVVLGSLVLIPCDPGLLRRLHDFFDLSHAGPNVDRSLRGFRTCRWQLKHRRLLAFHQVHQEQDVAIRKLQGFVKRVEAVYIDLPVRTPFCGG